MPAPSSSARTSSKCARSSSESRSTIFGAASVTARISGGVPVEGAQRVDLDPRALLGVEGVGAQQVVAQLARVLGAGLRRRRCSSGAAGCPSGRAARRGAEQVDQLGVHRGVVGADRLERRPGVLAVAPRLRRLVAEHRARVPELHRLRAACACRALYRRGRRARCPPGAASASGPTAILERVHLLAHDVGRLADRAREQAPCPRRSASRSDRSRRPRRAARASSTIRRRVAACSGSRS